MATIRVTITVAAVAQLQSLIVAIIIVPVAKSEEVSHVMNGAVVVVRRFRVVKMSESLR